ncbi:CPBP family intramembrane glutamic endopeptidase [Myroides fluvii]|uniref:CPBP family intramembrane glutamic endopeptidase n=1 Tax=Myroides fluvii TaxID=2572594 RepID=UPI00131CA616|nr:type II CAAX endopeptidase family protein [Myroides fluvii]
MKYIDQLQSQVSKRQILYYVPFTCFYLMIMFINWLVIKFSSISTKETINSQIEILGKNIAFFQLIIPFAIFLLLLALWVLFVHKQSLVRLTTSRAKIDGKRFGFAFACQAILILVSFAISYLLNPTNFVFNFNAPAFLGFFFIALIFIPIQTSFEEYFFRGYLMQGVGLATKNRGIALLVTSVIFGLLHLANPEVETLGSGIMVYYIGTGFFLGIVTLMDDGLELALGFHAANNLIGALLVTSSWTVFQTNSLFLNIAEQAQVSVWEFIWQVFVFYPILLLIFAKKYQWKDWKNRLFGRLA